MPTKKKAYTARFLRISCEHPDRYLEPCSDGYYCTACCEGVCPCCRKLWTEHGPRCHCHDALVLQETAT